MKNDPQALLARWQLDAGQVREQMYRAPTPRERERWHALWLLSQGWSASAVAAALERDPHTIGAWLDAFGRDGPAALTFAHTGGPPCTGYYQHLLCRRARWTFLDRLQSYGCCW